MKNIAILTRTYNRPWYFKRCRDSVKKCGLSENQYVIYHEKENDNYLIENDVQNKIFIDVNKFKVDEKPDKTIAKYNLLFNDAYSKIKEEWIFHLDDDNFLHSHGFKPIEKFLDSEHDLIFFRYRNQKLKRTIPSSRFIREKLIKKNHIDTLCFIVKKSLAEKVKWDGYKGGDYKFAEEANKLAKSVKWVDCVIGKRDHLGLGKSDDKSEEVKSEIKPIKINKKYQYKIKEPSIKRLTTTKHNKPYVGTLVMINSCEKDSAHLKLFKESKLYADIKLDDNFYVIEYYRGATEEKFGKNKLHLVGDEDYSLLHYKTYSMIKWCYKNYEFDKIVKLDCNWMTYDHVGPRTRSRLCSSEKVINLLYNRHSKNYFGTNGRYFEKKDYVTWMGNKRMPNKLDLPDYMNTKTWYYCGKAYSVSYDFAKFISTTVASQKIVEEHSTKNDDNYHEFAVEDYMIGRIFEKFLKSKK